MEIMDWHRSQFEPLAAAKAALPHALLMSGPRGIGKLAFAQSLARALLCEMPAHGGSSCGVCSGCNWFEAGTHPDYRQIEPAAESAEAEEAEKPEKPEKKAATIAIDQIRALPDFINISSHRGGPKVIVVHPAEALNVNAANALLKSLEEPPQGTYFLLVTHRPHQLLPTIKSRCQHIALRAPDPATATAWLAAQAVREPELALAHTGNAPLLALELVETEYWGARTAFFRQLTARDLDVLSAAEAVRDLPIPHLVAWLQKWSYDLVHYRATGRIRYNPDYREAIAQAGAQMDLVAASRFHREMVKLQRVVHHPLNARLFIENLLLAYRDLMQHSAAAA